MSKDIKKALEHCVEWNCDNCPNRKELGSGETVCRGRLLPEVLEYVSDLESKLAESEKQIKDVRETANMSVDSWCKNRRKYEAQIAEMQNKSFILYSMLYETLEKQGCENVASQIDQMTGWTYDKEADWLKGNRNYDQLKQQLAESENQCRECKHLNKKIELNIKNKLMAENCELQKQLAEKEQENERLNLEFETQEDWQEKWQKLYDETCNLTQDKISFAVDVLEEIADCSNYINSKLDFECGSYVSEKAIRNKIKYLKGKKDE